MRYRKTLSLKKPSLKRSHRPSASVPYKQNFLIRNYDALKGGSN